MSNKQTSNINLETVHRQMRAKYLITSELAKDEAQAQQIQYILRKLQREFLKSSMGMPITNYAYKKIIDKIRIMHPKLKNLFGTIKTGLNFESRMVDVLSAIAEAAAEEVGYKHMKQPITKISTGLQKASPFEITEVLDEISQEVLQQSGVKLNNFISKEQKQLAQGKLFLTEVYRKTDAQMVNINLTGTEDSELLSIYNALKGATFSLKNYDSNLSAYARDWWTKGIKLGGANFVRSIGASLKSLGYSTDAIMKLLYTNQSKYQTDSNIQNHFDHLAFIYELTGAGAKLQNNKLEYARFLCWNDPSGNITVRASRTLIKKMFDTNMLISENINGKKYYTIRKSNLFR